MAPHPLSVAYRGLSSSGNVYARRQGAAKSEDGAPTERSVAEALQTVAHTALLGLGYRDRMFPEFPSNSFAGEAQWRIAL